MPHKEPLSSESSLSRIEAFLFRGNYAHDLITFEKEGTEWLMTLQDCSEERNQKVFIFKDAKLEYQEFMLPAWEETEYPLPLIGADSRPARKEGIYRYCFNFSDIEVAFEASWPMRVAQELNPNA